MLMREVCFKNLSEEVYIVPGRSRPGLTIFLLLVDRLSLDIINWLGLGIIALVLDDWYVSPWEASDGCTGLGGL